MIKDMPPTENSLHPSADLFAQIAAEAAAEGRTVDEVAEELLRAALHEKSWQGALARNRHRGPQPGITEEQVVEQVSDVVHDWRKQQRGR